MASDFVLPEFLEDCDADTIHARMMDELPDDIDKTEGGFPWDFTRPTALIAAELLQFYIPEAIKLMFPQWSNGSFLDYIAAGSQTKRKAATYAEHMLTADAMNGFKGHVKKTVSHALYKIGSTYYRAEITDIYVDSTGKVAIDFTIDPTMSGTVKITEVQLYNRSGKLWLTKTENITRKSTQEGVFYRFTIEITEV